MEIMSIRLLKKVTCVPDCVFERCHQGEKYLVLRKKYRQMLQEKEAKLPRTDGEEQGHPSPAKTAAAGVQWDARNVPTRCLQQDEPMSCAAEVRTVKKTQQTVREEPLGRLSGTPQLFVLRNTFMCKQGRLCALLCIIAVKRCPLRHAVRKLAAALETQQVKGLTGSLKVGKAV